MNPNRLTSPSPKRRRTRSARKVYPEIWRDAPGSIAARVISQLLAARPGG